MNIKDGFNIIDAQLNLRMIVKALQKAIGSNTREYLINNNTDTNNAIILLRGDFINTNLRNMFAGCEDIVLKRFKRCAWTGRLLIDRKHKIVITISSKSTLHRVKNVNRRKSLHYAQSMCHVLNGDLEAPHKQISIADLDGFDIDPPFSEEAYEADFENIVDAAISQGEGYRYCPITYEADGFELKSVSIMLLDKDLDIVQEISLMNLLEPDFGNLTDPVAKIEEAPQKKDAHSLVKIKAGLKSKKTNEPGKKIEIATKSEEVEKWA
ncbi:MAG: hypothetical protein IJJ91_10890 [Synergistaceae bacterium]|nr:hypothetical protein [Synergistaceae bacterium]